MSKLTAFEIEQLASEIVSELENDVVTRDGLGPDWQMLDSQCIDEIKFYWHEIIVKHLQNTLLDDEIVENQ